MISGNEGPRSKAPRYLCEILRSPSTLLRQGYGGFSSPSSSQQAARYSAKENKEKALAISIQRLKLKNTALVEEAYQFYGPLFSFPPRVSHDGLRVVLESLAQRTSGTKLATNVDKYVDEKLLDELEREGLFKKISGKG